MLKPLLRPFLPLVGMSLAFLTVVAPNQLLAQPNPVSVKPIEMPAGPYVSPKALGVPAGKEDFEKLFKQADLNEVATLESGFVYEGGAAADRVKRIADKIISASGVKGVRVRTLRSGVANAYSLANGAIFVSLGLMAGLETDGELAFVIAHEIAHIKKKHAEKAVDRSKKASRAYKEGDAFGRLSLAYSRDNEFDADAEALTMIIAAGYAANEGVESLIKLRQLDSVVAAPPLDLEKMLGKAKVIKDSAKTGGMTTSRFIDGDDDDESDEKDDSRTTHPYVERRIEALRLLIKEMQRGKAETAVAAGSQSDYAAYRELFHYEVARAYYDRGDYALSLYRALRLFKNNPKPEAAAMISQSLMWCAALKEADSNDPPEAVDADDVGTDYQEVRNLLTKESAGALRELAYRFNAAQPESYEKNDHFAFVRAEVTSQYAGKEPGKIAFRRFVSEHPSSVYVKFAQIKLEK